MISIIVPIYNIEKYLEKCLTSIITQTYNNLEIILVDDGSTDTSGKICDDYAKKDKRIKVIHKENQGLVSARKTGILASTGEYIGYVDGDDWIEPDMYEKLYNNISLYGAEVCTCGRYEDTGTSSKKLIQDFNPGFYDKALMKEKIYPQMIVGDDFFDWKMSPAVWDKLFKRDLLINYQMQVDDRLKMGEDAACTYPLLLNAESICIIDDILYHYRQTTDSMVKQAQNYELERMQFSLLYQSVNRQFEKNKDIFDLREQWLRYVLFLMIPRADGLYINYEKQNFLFPFPAVKKECSIILYGAGTYGQRLYKYIKRTGFCKISAWVDRNYVELRKMGLDVSSPEVIETNGDEIIVIANTYYKSRSGLEKSLKEKYPYRMICSLDEKLIFLKETKKAFGLI